MHQQGLTSVPQRTNVETRGASSTDIKDMPDCFVLVLAEELAGV